MELVKRKSIFIYYEGETEYIYIDKLRRYFSEKYNLNKNNYGLKYKKEQISKDFVKKAVDLIKKEDYDYVVIVTDMEIDQDRIKTINKVKEDLKTCKYKDQIKLIISNPTFEFWLCSHFKYFNKQILKPKNLEKILAEYLKLKDGYRKADKKIINKFFDSDDLIETAIKNCKKTYNDKFEYSTSNFFELIELVVN